MSQSINQTTRLRRFSVLGVVLAAAIVAMIAWSVDYGRSSVRAANQMRVEANLRIYRVIAQIAAGLLDAQAREIAQFVERGAEVPSVVAALAFGAPGPVQLDLANLPSGGRKPTSLALYSATGARLASTSEASPIDAAHAPWFLSLARGANSRAISILRGAAGTRILGVAVPIRAAGGGYGCLLGWQPLDLVSDRLQQHLADASLALFVVDSRDEIQAFSGAATQTSEFDGQQKEPARLARAMGEGGIVVGPTASAGAKVVGFALAPDANLVAMTVDSKANVNRPLSFMVTRLSSLVLPGAVIVLLAAWTLISFYSLQRQLARQLVEHNRQLQEASQAKSDFLANVSHDLRTPLAGLQISISGLLDPGLEWDEALVRDSLHTAAEQIEHLSARVRNLLVMARIEAGAQPLRTGTCDLTDIVSSAMERIAPLLQGREVSADFPAEPMFVECDQAQLETVVVNLIENAVKYSELGSSAHLKGEVQEGEAVVTVRDRGPGVPVGDEARIFEKFYRASTVGPVGGTGLGLAICKSIIEQHGGEIAVRNLPEGGAEFSFSLPLADMESSEQLEDES